MLQHSEEGVKTKNRANVYIIFTLSNFMIPQNTKKPVLGSKKGKILIISKNQNSVHWR